MGRYRDTGGGGGPAGGVGGGLGGIFDMKLTLSVLLCEIKEDNIKFVILATILIYLINLTIYCRK